MTTPKPRKVPRISTTALAAGMRRAHHMSFGFGAEPPFRDCSPKTQRAWIEAARYARLKLTGKRLA